MLRERLIKTEEIPRYLSLLPETIREDAANGSVLVYVTQDLGGPSTALVGITAVRTVDGWLEFLLVYLARDYDLPDYAADMIWDRVEVARQEGVVLGCFAVPDGKCIRQQHFVMAGFENISGMMFRPLEPRLVPWTMRQPGSDAQHLRGKLVRNFNQGERARVAWEQYQKGMDTEVHLPGFAFLPLPLVKLDSEDYVKEIVRLMNYGDLMKNAIRSMKKRPVDWEYEEEFKKALAECKCDLEALPEEQMLRMLQWEGEIAYLQERIEVIRDVTKDWFFANGVSMETGKPIPEEKINEGKVDFVRALELYQYHEFRKEEMQILCKERLFRHSELFENAIEEIQVPERPIPTAEENEKTKPVFAELKEISSIIHRYDTEDAVLLSMFSEKDRPVYQKVHQSEREEVLLRYESCIDYLHYLTDQTPVDPVHGNYIRARFMEDVSDIDMNEPIYTQAGKLAPEIGELSKDILKSMKVVHPEEPVGVAAKATMDEIRAKYAEFLKDKEENPEVFTELSVQNMISRIPGIEQRFRKYQSLRDSCSLLVGSMPKEDVDNDELLSIYIDISAMFDMLLTQSKYLAVAGQKSIREIITLWMDFQSTSYEYCATDAKDYCMERVSKTTK